MGDVKVDKLSCNKEEEDRLQSILKSWNITECNHLNANCDLEDEEILEKLMKDYCEGLDKTVSRTVDLEALQKKVLLHIKVLYIYYIHVNSLKARDIYLNNMEHIMKISCNMELQILKIKKKPLFMRKREFKEMLVLKCTKSIIHALNAFLLGDECHITHVLMHLNDIEKSPLSKDVCNYLFHHFLVENAPKDLSVESYCRYYILFCKWKEITQRDDKKKSFDRLLSKMFSISLKTLEGSELWRKISQPPKPTMVEKVMEKFHPSVAKCVTYFDYFNKETVMKIENFEKASSADEKVNQTSICGPSKSLQEIKNIVNEAAVIDLCDADDDDDVEFISAKIPNPVCIIDDDEIDHIHDDEDIEFVSRIRIVKETSFLKAINIVTSKRNSKQARKEIVNAGETDITSHSFSVRESFLDSIDISSSIEMCSATNLASFLDSITVPERVPGTNTIPLLDPVTTLKLPDRPLEDQGFSFESAAELHDLPSSPNIEETISSESVYPPKIMTEQPVTVIEGPLAMTEQPVTVLEEPLAVTEQPITVIEEPLIMSEQPVAVMEQPDTITEKPVTLIEQTGVEALPNTMFKYISYLTQHISLSVLESGENITPSEMVIATEILQPPKSPTHTSSITYMNMLVDCVEKMQRANNEKTAMKIKMDSVQPADTSSTVTFAKEDSVSETNSENCAEFRTTCVLTENYCNSTLFSSPSDNHSPKVSFCEMSEAPNALTSTLTKQQNPNLNINEFIDETPDGIDITEFEENIRLTTKGSLSDAATNTEDDIESLNIENQLLSDNYEPEQIRQKLVTENQSSSDESVMCSSGQEIIPTDPVNSSQDRKDNDVPSLDTGCTKELKKAYENTIDTGQKEFKIKPCLIYLKRNIENRIAKSIKGGTENHLKCKESKKRIKVNGRVCTDLNDSQLLNSGQAVKRHNSSVCNNSTYTSKNNSLEHNSEKSVVKLNKPQKHVRFEDIVERSSERKSSQRKHKIPRDCGHIYKRSSSIKTDNNINNKNDSFVFNNQFFKPYNNIVYDNSLFTSENRGHHDSEILIVKPKKKKKQVRFEDVKTTESNSTYNAEKQRVSIDSAQAYGHYHKSQADITKRSSKPDDKKSEFVKVEYDKTTTNINAKDTVAVIQGDQQQTYPLQNNSNKRTGSYIAYRSQGKLSVSKRTSGLTLDQFEIYLATQGASERKRVYRKATKESPLKTTVKRVKSSTMSKNHKAEIDKLLENGVYISTPFSVNLG